jgi:DNA polymerase-3 subunit chi
VPPRVDFYVLAGQAPNGRLLLACRLTEKAYKLGHTVYLHAASALQAQQVDDLLWTFRQSSFIPHGLYPPLPDDRSPVRIGWGEVPAAAQVLINLSHELPAGFARFERVVELVDQMPETLARSRERFRHYREQGYAPATHRIEPA